MNPRVEMKGKHQDQIYEVKCNTFLADQHPNLVVILAIYIVTKHVNTIVPFVLTSPSPESIFLDKNEIVGLLD